MHAVAIAMAAATQPSALPLVFPDPDDGSKLCVGEDAVRVLETLQAPLAVVAVAGG